MSADERTINVSCLCGILRHSITLPSSAFPLPACLCHCTSCRRLSGNLAVSGVKLPRPYRPAAGVLAKLTPYVFSSRLTFYHCGTCGAHLYVRCDHGSQGPRTGEDWDISTGTIEQPEGVFEFKYHEHIADTLDGGISDLVPSLNGVEIRRYAHSPRKQEELPLHWRSIEFVRDVEAGTEGTLSCRCKCGGVEFWVRRPSVPLHAIQSGQPNSDPASYQLDLRGLASRLLWTPTEAKSMKLSATLCDCTPCRQASGQEWMAWASIPPACVFRDAGCTKPLGYRDDGKMSGLSTLKEYDKSHLRGLNPCSERRYHCTTCGANVFRISDDRVELIQVAVGLFEAPEGARAESWLKWKLVRLSWRDEGAVHQAPIDTLFS